MPYSTSETVDAVVIGTGAGGAPLLARLAAAGLKVVALEAGKHWNPTTDFATDEKAQEKLFWTDERLSAGNDPIPFGSNNSGTGVGGSTLHYTAYTPRAQPDDFRIRTDFGVGEDWPILFTSSNRTTMKWSSFWAFRGRRPIRGGQPEKAVMR